MRWGGDGWEDEADETVVDAGWEVGVGGEAGGWDVGCRYAELGRRGEELARV